LEHRAIGAPKPAYVRFCLSGHSILHRTCLLLTQRHYLRRPHWTTLSWHHNSWNWQADSRELSVLARLSWPRRAFTISAVVPTLVIALVRLGDSDETARIHHPTWRCGSRMAAGGSRNFRLRAKTDIPYPFFLGTFLPFCLAFESPIAMACLRLFTLPPLPWRPLLAFPRL
jgi:hypothetical protein